MSVFCEKEGYVDKNQDKAIFQVIEELQDKIKVMQNRIDKHEENERKLLEANKRFQVQIEEMENRIKSTRGNKEITFRKTIAESGRGVILFKFVCYVFFLST